MPTRSNKHITKFNQLVEVYEPADIEPMESVTSQDEAYLEDRKAEIEGYRTAVEGLELSDFFDESRREEIRTDDSMPAPSVVAESQKAEMLDRLELIEEAITETIEGIDGLDTGEFEL